MNDCWTSALCHAANEIAHECDALRTSNPAPGGCKWPRWTLMEEGAWVEEHCSHCPRTTALLQSMPLCDSGFGYAYFSVLPANSRVGKHCGVTNLKLRGHLTLHTPPAGTECGIRVQGRSQGWQEAGLVFFDDSFEHEVWNNSDTERVILLFDIWHPQLTNADFDHVRACYAPQALKGTGSNTQTCVDASECLGRPAIASCACTLAASSASFHQAASSPMQHGSIELFLQRDGLARYLLGKLLVIDVVHMFFSCRQWHSLASCEAVWADLLWRDFCVKSRTSCARYKELCPRLHRCSPGDHHESDVHLQFLTIGDSGVGKSSFIRRLEEDTFGDSYICNIGVDFKIMRVRYRGMVVKLQLWDTAGPERFRSITSAYYRGCDGVIVMYDQTDRTSFEQAANWLGEVRKYGRHDTQVLLCASKDDLPSAKKTITREEGTAKAAALGLGFAEISAKTGTGVDCAMATLLHLCMPIKLEKIHAADTTGPKGCPEQHHRRCSIQ